MKEMFVVLSTAKDTGSTCAFKIITSKRKALAFLKEEINVYNLTEEGLINYFTKNDFISYTTANFHMRITKTEVH